MHVRNIDGSYFDIIDTFGDTDCDVSHFCLHNRCHFILKTMYLQVEIHPPNLLQSIDQQWCCYAVPLFFSHCSRHYPPCAIMQSLGRTQNVILVTAVRDLSLLFVFHLCVDE